MRARMRDGAHNIYGRPYILWLRLYKTAYIDLNKTYRKIVEKRLKNQLTFLLRGDIMAMLTKKDGFLAKNEKFL